MEWKLQTLQKSYKTRLIRYCSLIDNTELKGHKDIVHVQLLWSAFFFYFPRNLFKSFLFLTKNSECIFF